MARCAPVRGTGSGPIRPPARPAWLVTLCAAVIALLAACSGNLENGASTGTPSPGASGRASAGAPAGAVIVTIKVVTHSQATLALVPVYVDGQGPYTFLPDTGSSISSVSRQLAAQLRLHHTGSTT